MKTLMDIRLNIILFFVLSAFTAHAGEDNNELFHRANEKYAQGDYTSAVTIYENILGSGKQASDVYFNLGNAYYRLNKIGLAILNYEKARKLSPDDEDIETNLTLANMKVEDKIESTPSSFLSHWVTGVGSLASERGWSIMLILVFSISIVLLVFYFISFHSTFKRLFFYLSVIGFLFSIVTFSFALHQYRLLKQHNEAIVLAPSTTVRSSPDEKSTKLFVLHEGTKVFIIEQEDKWIKLKLSNGNVGWLPITDIGRI